jgi:hypothetical protein
VQSDVAALTRTSEFLTIARTATLGGVDRPLLERYLAWLASQAIGHGARTDAITSVSAFLQAIRQHGWDNRAHPLRFTTPVVRDEREQARYLREVLSELDRSAIDAAFVNTFARYDLRHDDADDDRDFDKASFGIVKVLDSGRAGTAYPGLPWEPKAAFHALADYGRTRAESTGDRPAAAV